jgi:hypothetical protein
MVCNLIFGLLAMVCNLIFGLLAMLQHLLWIAGHGCNLLFGLLAMVCNLIFGLLAMFCNLFFGMLLKRIASHLGAIGGEALNLCRCNIPLLCFCCLVSTHTPTSIKT